MRQVSSDTQIGEIHVLEGIVRLEVLVSPTVQCRPRTSRAVIPFFGAGSSDCRAPVEVGARAANYRELVEVNTHASDRFQKLLRLCRGVNFNRRPSFVGGVAEFSRRTIGTFWIRLAELSPMENHFMGEIRPHRLSDHVSDPSSIFAIYRASLILIVAKFV